MPSRIDEAGHTKAFDDPVAEHWGESQRAKRSLVGFEPTSAQVGRWVMGLIAHIMMYDIISHAVIEL